MLPLSFVINGEEIRFAVDPDETVAEARDHALKTSCNTGRPASGWEVRMDTGQLVDPDAVMRDFQFRNGERLYVTLRIGAGGSSYPRSREATDVRTPA